MSSDKICPTCGAVYGTDHAFCPLDSSPLRPAVEGDELVGCVIAGRYLVSDRIGSGGMGEVYQAQDVRLQRPAAIKVLRASLAGDPDSLARFRREAANASKISSQHVAQMYDYGETEQGRPFLAMEFIPGQSLRAIVDREAPLEPSRVAALIGQIAAGLEAAHALHIVHRDLKPDNVLVVRDESGGELAKVVDFGISKGLRDLNQRVTKTGFVSGTYEFMSPEQIMAGAPDHRTDIYALGLITFLMLTGTLPFAGETAEHSMLLRLSQAPRTLREALPNLQGPDDLQAAMDGALARDPAERYSSAATFARALGDAIERWQRTPAESGRPVGRRRILIGGGAAIAALGLGMAMYLGAVGEGETEVLTPVTAVPDTFEAVEMGNLRPPPDDADTRVTIDSAQEQPEPPQPRPTQPTRTKQRSSDRPSQPPSKPDDGPSRLTAPEAAALLETYESVLLSEPPDDSVRQVIRSLDGLLRRLGTKRDSVQAAIYLAEANALIGLQERACAILDSARRKATRIQRERIEVWDSQGLCKFTRWTPS